MKYNYLPHTVSHDPLSPVTINNKDPVTAVDDGSCSYSGVSPQDAPYIVSVVATNDVGDSDAVLVDNISKWNILHFKCIDTCYFSVSTRYHYSAHDKYS